MKVRNWIFSNFDMSIYFKNIKDIAYSKNHFLHYMFDYGTFFARSSAGATGDFEASSIPKVQKVHNYVNNIYLLSEENRELLDTLEDLDNSPKLKKPASKESIEEIVEKEKQNLMNIQWIKEVIRLTDADRVFIFENEEDRNHWVYETLRKKILFAVTHDSTLREPDEQIVLQKWKKTIFPTVKFHEIDRPWVISSSPGLVVNDYLKDKFKDMDEYDATLVIGFDV